MTEPTPPIQVSTAATFCATLVDEWVRSGVRRAVVCPGSRSTPMAIALAAREGIEVSVHHDERSAGFVALGCGLADAPAVVLTTSGTAAAELHPAVVEADLAGVPMIVCTADRPPELHDIGAPQTIDQTHLFGKAVRWFADPGVPDQAQAHCWRSLAARSVLASTDLRPGPVHLNLAFRDPLVGRSGPLPAGRADGTPWHAQASPGQPGETAQAERVVERLEGRRGVILVGAGRFDPSALHRLARALGWPVLTGPRAHGAWTEEATTVAHADALLRVGPFAADHRPEIVLRLGGLLASKVIAEWLAGIPVVAAMAPGQWVDPGQQVALATSETLYLDLALAFAGRRGTPTARDWLLGWQRAEAAARRAIATAADVHAEPTEPAIARDLMAAMPHGSDLVVSSSMPIRDVEWYSAPRDGVDVLANRGANGIDGVVSTAVGVALVSGRPTAVLVGDVAFLHDTNALLALARRGLDLTIVVVDNDGGGIFSFLPQASAMEPERFERLFGTPHGVDLTKLADAHGIPWQVIGTQADVGPAVAASTAGSGTRLLVVRTDRAANVAVHADLHAAVASAVTAL